METRPCPGLTLPDEKTATLISRFPVMSPPPAPAGFRFVRADDPVQMENGEWLHVFTYAPVR